MTFFDEIKKRYEKRYYIIKDYVVGKLYIASESATNILFGALLTDTKLKNIANLDYLTTLGIKQQIIFCGNNNDPALFVGDCKLYTKKENTPSLIQELNKTQQEIFQGIDYSTRRKTEEEINQGITVRVVGVYESLTDAQNGYALIHQKEKENNILEFEEQERVFIKYPHSQVPKNFSGKVIQSAKTTREFT